MSSDKALFVGLWHLRSSAGALFLLLIVSAGCASISTSAYGVAFGHGVLAFESGNYEEAAQLFEEAVRSDRREGTARHWLGLTYLRLGRPRDAIDQLKASLQATYPAAAGRERVLEDLAAAQAASTATGPKAIPAVEAPEGEGLVLSSPTFVPPRWEGRIGVEAVWDSNPALAPGELLLPVNGVSAAAEDDAAQIDVHIEHHPFYDRNGWSLGLALSGNQSVHRNASDLNFGIAEGILSLVHGRDLRGYLPGPLGSTRVPSGTDRWTLLLQGRGASSWLGGNSYLSVAEGAASLTWHETSRLATRMDFELRYRSFAQDGSGALQQSGGEVALAASQYFWFGAVDRYLRLGLRSGERGGGRAFEGSFFEASGELSTFLSPRWTLFFLGIRGRDRFRHPDSGFSGPLGPEREDETWRILGSSIVGLGGGLYWTVRGGYIHRDSNTVLAPGLELFDYDREVFSTGVTWLF